MLAQSERPALRTCSYWEPPQGFTVVRTSLGTPKGMNDLPRLVAAAPPRAIWGTDDYAARYLDVLDRRAVTILRALDRLHEDHGPLALACFEPDPANCHRSLLAGWLVRHGRKVEVVR